MRLQKRKQLQKLIKTSTDNELFTITKMIRDSLIDRYNDALKATQDNQRFSKSEIRYYEKQCEELDILIKQHDEILKKQNKKYAGAKLFHNDSVA